MKRKISSLSENRAPGRLLWLAILTPLLQRLLVALPATDPVFWMVGDTLRAVAYAALAAWCTSLIPYRHLREKCLSAAFMGYGVADTAICVLWYGWDVGGFLPATLVLAMGFFGAAILYWARSYSRPSVSPEPSRIYCLRKRPIGVQGLLIALAGIFGSDGEYAIYCRGYVFQFRRGEVQRIPYSPAYHSGFHVTVGSRCADGDELALLGMVGIKWRLFGPNCVTLLGRFWRRHVTTR